MILGLSLALLLLFCVAAANNWRLGVFLATVMAFLQDPLRKLTPDQSPIFILYTGIVFSAAVLGAFLGKVKLTPGSIADWKRYLALPFQLYVFVVFLQAGHSLIRYGSPLLMALGLVNYLAPVIAQMLGYSFGLFSGISGTLKFLRFYLSLASAALLTVYLQSTQITLPVFGEVGVGVGVYRPGVTIIGYSGIFRAAEIAGWHAATAACVAILIFTNQKPTVQKTLFMILLVITFVGIGVLTGRRKMLVMVVIFILAYWSLLVSHAGRARGAVAIACLGALAYAAIINTLGDEEIALADRDSEYTQHLAHSFNVFSDVPERVTELGIAPLTWAYDCCGIFGTGLGTANQGARYVIPDIETFSSGNGEGGLGKLALELGFPGFLIITMLGIAFVRHVSRLLATLSNRSPQAFRLACGLSALLVANVASFSVATQTYGDIFVLLFIGLTLGTMLATPLMASGTNNPRLL